MAVVTRTRHAGRPMDLTPDLVARCFRVEPNPGPNPAYTPVTEDELSALTNRLMAEHPGGPVWVFAYGSLIWKPTFEAVDIKPGTALGWHRSFCMELTRWRGSPDRPGLMMGLAWGGRCNGLLLRVSDENPREEVFRLVKREIGLREDLGMARWIRVRSGDEAVPALVFWAGPKGPGFYHGLPLETVAYRIAHACGHAGSNAEYLFHTVAKLEEHGIRDRNLWRLQQLVAAEVRRWEA